MSIKVRWWNAPIAPWNLAKVTKWKIAATNNTILPCTSKFIKLALFREMPGISYKILVLTSTGSWDSAL